MASAVPRLVMVVALAAALALGACGQARPAPPAVPARTPDQRQVIPRGVERALHRRLHEIDAGCRSRDLRRIGRTTQQFLQAYRRFPAQRFRLTIDGEDGSMLSAVLVLRSALRTCAPDQARRLDEVLPARIRRALTPVSR